LKEGVEEEKAGIAVAEFALQEWTETLPFGEAQAIVIEMPYGKSKLLLPCGQPVDLTG
jgi:hypothetical protein